MLRTQHSFDVGLDVESEKEGLINSIMGATSATGPLERLTTEMAAKVVLRVL